MVVYLGLHRFDVPRSHHAGLCRLLLQALLVLVNGDTGYLPDEIDEWPTHFTSVFICGEADKIVFLEAIILGDDIENGKLCVIASFAEDSNVIVGGTSFSSSLQAVKAMRHPKSHSRLKAM